MTKRNKKRVTWIFLISLILGFNWFYSRQLVLIFSDLFDPEFVQIGQNVRWEVKYPEPLVLLSSDREDILVFADKTINRRVVYTLYDPNRFPAMVHDDFKLLKEIGNASDLIKPLEKGCFFLEGEISKINSSKRNGAVINETEEYIVLARIETDTTWDVLLPSLRRLCRFDLVEIIGG